MRRYKVILLTLLVFSGCKTNRDAANDLNNDIQKQTILVTGEVKQIQTDVSEASVKIRTASTHPSVIPEVKNQLDSAQIPLADADKHASNVLKTVPKIQADGEGLKNTVNKSEDAKEKAQAFWGYKWGKRLEYFLASLAVGLVLFLIFSGGNIPVILNFIAEDIWPVIRKTLIIILHTCTLGVSWIIFRLHHHGKQIKAQNANK